MRWLFFLCCILQAGLAHATEPHPLRPAPLPQLQMPAPERVALGRLLFFDRRLSGDGTMSCATCHIPEEGFADGQPLSGAYPTSRHWRHTPNLLNVAYLQFLFWDGRSHSLEDQASGPIQAAFEMNLPMAYLEERLRESPGYVHLFQQVFGRLPDRQGIVAALADFQRTLVVHDSPFDRYLQGDAAALGTAGRRGLDIFFGERGGCAACHSGALLSDQQFHNIGVEETDSLRQDPLRRTTRNFFLTQMGLERQERDPGRFAVTRQADDVGAFRTPALRQIAETAPYMHNGSLATLEAVIDFFNAGGGSDPDKSPKMQPRNFSAQEKEDLLAFLRSLSGTVPRVRPPVVPD
jgi:cytochrome c peroxidase